MFGWLPNTDLKRLTGLIFNTKEMEKPLDKVFICDRIQHFSNKLVKACNEGDEVLTGHYAAKIRGFLEQLDRWT